MNAGQKFRLRHFQRDGQRAFLAFAAKLRGGFSVEQQLQIVAMRSDERGTIVSFPAAGLREFHGKILFHTGLILNAQFLRIVGNAAIGQPGQRGKFRRQFAPGADDFVAELHQFLRKTVERGFVHGALLEQRVAGANGAHVPLEQGKVTGLRLGQQQIQEPAPRARRAFDQLQIFRAEHHRAQHAEIIRQFFHRLAVQRQFALTRRPEHFDFARALAGEDGCLPRPAQAGRGLGRGVLSLQNRCHLSPALFPNFVGGEGEDGSEVGIFPPTTVPPTK